MRKATRHGKTMRRQDQSLAFNRSSRSSAENEGAKRAKVFAKSGHVSLRSPTMITWVSERKRPYKLTDCCLEIDFTNCGKPLALQVLVQPWYDYSVQGMPDPCNGPVYCKVSTRTGRGSQWILQEAILVPIEASFYSSSSSNWGVVDHTQLDTFVRLEFSAISHLRVRWTSGSGSDNDGDNDGDRTEFDMDPVSDVSGWSWVPDFQSLRKPRRSKRGRTRQIRHASRAQRYDMAAGHWKNDDDNDEDGHDVNDIVLVPLKT